MRNSTPRPLHIAPACLLAACILLATPPLPCAMTAKPLRSVDRVSTTTIPITARLGYGTLKGEAHEVVYTGSGRKLSDLTWKVDTPVLGAQCTAEPAPWLALSIGAWTKTGETTTYMEDFDWVFASDPDTWSHWSESPTTLEKGYMADANANLIIPIAPATSFLIILGFRHDSWKWKSHGGEYIYSQNGGFRNDSGNLPDGTGITYEQWFYSPYAGLGVNIDRDRFHLHTRLTGSKWAWADDEDHHHLRGLVFEDTFENLYYCSAGAEISFDVTRLFSISLSADYQKYEEDKKGDIKEISADGVRTFDESAGISHESHMFTLSLDFRF